MSRNPTKLLTVVGARPQFVKAAVISRYLRESDAGGRMQEILVHTGQHYDLQMSDVFFRELEIPTPQHNLQVGSGTSSAQLSVMIERLGPVLEAERPDMVLVYGDTHSTLAAALVAAHMNVPVIHVEAGERIYRRFLVPEETNRVLTDNVASLCLTCSQRATSYLLREGMAPERVRFVGDPMYELFLWAKQRFARFASVTAASCGVEPQRYFLATIHRAQNTRDIATVVNLFKALDQAPLPVLLPVHPRVSRLLSDSNWTPSGSLRLLEPLGYFDFLSLLFDCYGTITDSGGVSRESFYAGKPCIVPMQNCWWPEVVEAGWICEAGPDPQKVLEATRSFRPPDTAPQGLFGDGHSAEKIVREIVSFVEEKQEPRWHRLGACSDLPAACFTAFIFDGYRRLIDGLKSAGYRFLTFPKAQAALNDNTPFALLRHDIDMELEAALKLAEIEAEAGVQATYFFLVRTETYNLFSSAGIATISNILKMGHHLGLHFDCASYDAESSVENLRAACGREAALLEQ